MSRFWSPLVHSLTPYVPGEQPKLANLVKLNTNENPYPPSPLALEAIAAETGDSLKLYPDPNGERLKAAVAEHFRAHAIRPAQIFVGNGSDEVLAHAFQALLKHEAPILFPDITYSFYPVYCGLYGVDYRSVPLTEEFEIRAEDYCASAPHPQPLSREGEGSTVSRLRDLRKPGGIIFPNPNAPTGRLLSLQAVESIVAGNPDAVVLVDEAYIDFAGDSIPTAIALVNRYPNLLVVHTLSKSRSLAGLRVGYAVGHPELIEALERVKNSFNSYPLDKLALAGATAAMQDEAWFDATRKKVIASRVALSAGLTELGFSVLPSAANFIFARHRERGGADLAAALRARSIIVRHFNLPRIDAFLRITIGTEEQCQALLAALTEILKG